MLGFQHFIVMLGTSVIIPSALVPQMGGGNVSPPRPLKPTLIALQISHATFHKS
jgi:nucleobase transporter 1/2